MLQISVVLNHFRHISPPLLEMALEVRNLVGGISPDATERLNRDGLTYFDEKRGGPVRGGLCGLAFCDDHLRLSFGLGAFLPDPRGLLQAETGRKAMRVMLLHTYASVDWDGLRDLIAAAHQLEFDGVIMQNLPEGNPTARKR